MSGRRLTEQQVKNYRKFRKQYTQAISAAKAGISERSARRIDRDELQPNVSQVRQWRTRIDPLEGVWESIVLPWICNDSDVTPVEIFSYLCEYHQDTFNPNSRRTLERRIAEWYSVNGR